MARILVVDDEADMRDTVAYNLAKLGHQVLVAGNGREALAVLAGAGTADVPGVDLIVSDVTMPEMDGIDLCGRVRCLADHLLTPFLFVTARRTADDHRRGLRAGADDYIGKPFELEELLLRIEARLAVRDRLLRATDGLRQLRPQAGHAPAAEAPGAAGDAALSRALAASWLALQPIVSVPRRAAVAYEALLRTDDREIPHVGALLQAAERLGRTLDLGRLVRRQAAGRVADLEPGQDLFVNLHPRDLTDPELVDPAAPLSRYAPRVVLEITERAALAALGEIEEPLARLRGLGYRLAVDDLGAGYSGLSSLVGLCPEVVKVDMSLVRDVHAEPVKQRVIEALIHLCASMQVVMVFEGVENAAEAATLVGLGAQLLQGYHFGRPAKEIAPPRPEAFA